MGLPHIPAAAGGAHRLSPADEEPGSGAAVAEVRREPDAAGPRRPRPSSAGSSAGGRSASSFSPDADVTAAPSRSTSPRKAGGVLPEIRATNGPSGGGGASAGHGDAVGEEDIDDTDNTVAGRAPLRKTERHRRGKIGVCLRATHYPIVGTVAKQLGYQIIKASGHWSLYWADSWGSASEVTPKRWQMINHFPGMSGICRKDSLGRNLARLREKYPTEFRFFPKTWVLPADLGVLAAHHRDVARAKRPATYIFKPSNSCQGRGISLFKNPKAMKPDDHGIVQQYLARPLLIEGFKADFRFYVLVTRCVPEFRIFLFHDGLARLATTKYRAPTAHNIDNNFCHLTNYSINKFSEDFDDAEGSDEGSKRKLSWLFEWLGEQGYPVDRIKADIDDVIIKTMLSVENSVRHGYKTLFPKRDGHSACCEILGFDIMLDERCKPWIIEVNMSPSFKCDAPLDRDVKENAIRDAIELVRLQPYNAAFERIASQSNLRQKAFRPESRQAAANGQKKTRELTLDEEDALREQEAAQKEADVAKYLRELTEHEDRCCETGGFRRIYPTGTPRDEQYRAFSACVSNISKTTAATTLRNQEGAEQRARILDKEREQRALRAAAEARAAKAEERAARAAEARRKQIAKATASAPKRLATVRAKSKHVVKPSTPFPRPVYPPQKTMFATELPRVWNFYGAGEKISTVAQPWSLRFAKLGPSDGVPDLPTQVHEGDGPDRRRTGGLVDWADARMRHPVQPGTQPHAHAPVTSQPVSIFSQVFEQLPELRPTGSPMSSPIAIRKGAAPRKPKPGDDPSRPVELIGGCSPLSAAAAAAAKRAKDAAKAKSAAGAACGGPEQAGGGGGGPAAAATGSGSALDPGPAPAFGRIDPFALLQAHRRGWGWEQYQAAAGQRLPLTDKPDALSTAQRAMDAMRYGLDGGMDLELLPPAVDLSNDVEPPEHIARTPHSATSLAATLQLRLCKERAKRKERQQVHIDAMAEQLRNQYF